jgi:hypothetical protein
MTKAGSVVYVLRCIDCNKVAAFAHAPDVRDQLRGVALCSDCLEQRDTLNLPVDPKFTEHLKQADNDV